MHLAESWAPVGSSCAVGRARARARAHTHTHAQWQASITRGSGGGEGALPFSVQSPLSVTGGGGWWSGTPCGAERSQWERNSGTRRRWVVEGGGWRVEGLPTSEIDAAYSPRAPPSWNRTPSCGGWGDRARSAGEVPAFGHRRGGSRLLPVLKVGRSGREEDADGGGDCRRRRAHFGGRVRTRAGQEGRFFISVWSLLSVLHKKLCTFCRQAPRAFSSSSPKRPIVSISCTLTAAALFCPNTCIWRCWRCAVTFCPPPLMPCASPRTPNGTFNMNGEQAVV